MQGRSGQQGGATRGESVSKSQASTLIWQSRKARHTYAIESELEAGLVLEGTEVKALRAGLGHLNDGYVQVRDGIAYLLGGYIGPYAFGNRHNHATDRPRILLLHRREIVRLAQEIQRQGATAVPLALYFKGGRVKVKLGIGVGKKTVDKRHAIKERDTARDVARTLRQRQR